MWNLRTVLTLVLALAGTGVSATPRPNAGHDLVRGDLTTERGAGTTHANQAERHLEARSDAGPSKGAGTSKSKGSRGKGKRKINRQGGNALQNQFTNHKATPADKVDLEMWKQDVKSKYGNGKYTKRLGEVYEYSRITQPVWLDPFPGWTGPPPPIPSRSGAPPSAGLTRTVLGGMGNPFKPNPAQFSYGVPTTSIRPLQSRRSPSPSSSRSPSPSIYLRLTPSPPHSTRDPQHGM